MFNSTNNHEAGSSHVRGAEYLDHKTSCYPDEQTKITNEASDLINGTSSNEERAAIHSMVSVRVVHQVISKFNQEKQQLVRDIGFGGMLHFPAINQLDRRFSFWLMTLVSPSSHCLIMPDGTKIPFAKEDIAKVFGIPCSGKKVQEALVMSKEMKRKIDLACWPNGTKINRSVKGVIDVLCSNDSNRLDEQEKELFQIAFVIFVMTVVFVPGAKYDYVSLDYWRALSNPNLISTYDWSDYVLKRLLDSAVKVQTDMASRSPSAFITGCSLFLQVLYLDSIELENLSKPHNIQPRISVFTYDQLRASIAKISNTSHKRALHAGYVTSELRKDKEICYSWSTNKTVEICSNKFEEKIALWEASVEFAKVLHIPLEAVGPIFLAVAEFQSLLPPSLCTMMVKFISVIVHLIQPYTNGVNYCFKPNSSISGTQIGAVVHGSVESCTNSSVSKLKRKAHDLHGNDPLVEQPNCPNNCSPGSCSSSSSSCALVEPGCLCKIYSALKRCGAPVQERGTGSHLDNTVVKAMSQFYLLINRLKSHSQIDLNVEQTSPENSWIKLPVPVTKSTTPAKNPWEIAHTKTEITLPPSCTMTRILESMKKVSEMSSLLIAHPIPKAIEVTVSAARDQVLGTVEFEMDLLDAILRRITQCDDTTYKSQGRLRWRHFFETDIMARLLAGSFDTDMPSVQEQFIGSHLSYDVYNCSVWFFPTLVQDHWVCFVWNLIENHLIIYDPMHENRDASNKFGTCLHIAEMLKQKMQTCIPQLFARWIHDWGAASVVPYFCYDRKKKSTASNMSGLLTAAFCLFFDGYRIRPEINKFEGEHLMAYLISEVMQLQGNSAQNHNI